VESVYERTLLTPEGVDGAEVRVPLYATSDSALWRGYEDDAGMTDVLRGPITYASSLYAIFSPVNRCRPSLGHSPRLAIGFLALMMAQPLVYVALRAVLTQISSTNQGATFGWFGLVSDLDWVLGPLITTGLLGVLDSLIFAVLGALAMLGAALAWTIHSHLKEPAEENQPALTSRHSS
jgi:hypothetical protein